MSRRWLLDITFAETNKGFGWLLATSKKRSDASFVYLETVLGPGGRRMPEVFRYPLQVKLREDKIFVFGTVNSNRKFLPTLKEDKHLQRGEHDYRICDTKRKRIPGLTSASIRQKQTKAESVNSNCSSAASYPGPAFIKRHKPTVPQEIRLECSRHQPERSTSRRCCRYSIKISPVRFE
ncbi:hypothetical protein EVAR_78087_1 [Eumeta japonica]|uniref:Uncharacterized protein n=1 Tax=Eumeta variegata TaxID=151549 RepID=A0A4C1T3A5_EUMVA|nr:hypothetical protein EVAR_78087_1 [Eumeta japonica]